MPATQVSMISGEFFDELSMAVAQARVSECVSEWVG